MKAADIMTRRVITIHDDAPIDEAARLMLQDNISGLPVVDRAGRLVGIVTEGDFLRRSETGTEKRRAKWLDFLIGPGRLADEYVHAHGRRVGEIMSTKLISVGESTALAEVVRLMERHQVKRVLVTRDGALAGVISRSNLLQALARIAPEAAATSASDQAIRDRVLAEMAALPWMPSRTINPIVRNGVVSLHGTIFEDSERRALRVLAENVPAVKGVEDHLAWIDPYTGTVIEQDHAA